MELTLFIIESYYYLQFVQRERDGKAAERLCETRGENFQKITT